ncbi:hypothetical protein [Aeromonas caviae]|jgi:hypothetical protein|uniref:hypothetical protein n=1 Tax=Aeromonas caviae TaxID=648 RepID=UPI00385E6C94
MSQHITITDFELPISWERKMALLDALCKLAIKTAREDTGLRVARTSGLMLAAYDKDGKWLNEHDMTEAFSKQSGPALLSLLKLKERFPAASYAEIRVGCVCAASRLEFEVNNVVQWGGSVSGLIHRFPS